MENQLDALQPEPKCDWSVGKCILSDQDHDFNIWVSPFRIEHYYEDELVMTLNDGDSLYFESSTGVNDYTCLASSQTDFSWAYPSNFVRNQTTDCPSYATSIDYQMAVGLGA